MHLAVTTTSRTPFQELTPRLAPGPATGTFKDVLAAVQNQPAAPAPDPIVVKSGQCLSQICSDYLKQQGGIVTPGELRAAVQETALANHLANPNRIYAGQHLDLSGLSALSQNAPGPKIESHETGWKGLVGGSSRISSGYGWRRDPFTGHLQHHDGIDVSAPAGAAIHAFAAGQVVYAGWKHGFGNTVIIRHSDGVETVYAHASKLTVQSGDSVEAEASIGSVGSTGRSTGSHLHFEVRKDGKTMNPLAMLNAGGSQLAQAAPSKPRE